MNGVRDFSKRKRHRFFDKFSCRLISPALTFRAELRPFCFATANVLAKGLRIILNHGFASFSFAAD
jgi:hypothetical protein